MRINGLVKLLLIFLMVMVLNTSKAQESSVQTLICSDFISQAMKNDPDFQVSLQQYLKSTYQTLSAQAMSAWTLSSGVGLSHIESTDTSGTQPGAIDTLSYQVSIDKLFLNTGTRVSLHHGNGINRFDYGSSGPLVLDFGSGPISLFDQPNESSTPAVKLTLVQPLLKNAFGLAARYPLRQARLQEQGAYLDVQEAWENRLAALVQHYLEWLAAYENVNALNEIVVDIERLEKIVAKKAKAGVVERTDLLRTRDNLLRYRTLITQAETNLHNKTLDIVYLQTGQFSQDRLRFKISPSDQESIPQCAINRETLEPLAIKSLRIMQKMDLLKGQLQATGEVAKNDDLPNLDFVGEVGIKGREDNQSGGYGNIGDKTDYSIMLQASYPIGNPKAQGDIGSTEAGLKEIEANTLISKRTLELTTTQLVENIISTEKVIALDQAKLENAKEKVDLDKNNYKIGRLDTFYLIDAQNALTNARLQLVNTQIRLKKLRVQYLALTDQLLSQFPEIEKQLSILK